MITDNLSHVAWVIFPYNVGLVALMNRQTLVLFVYAGHFLAHRQSRFCGFL